MDASKKYHVESGKYCLFLVSCPAQLSVADVDKPKREFQNPAQTRLDKIKVWISFKVLHEIY